MWVKKHSLRHVVENYLYQTIANKIMNEKYNVYLISDSTGETLDRIFLSLKSQFKNFDYEKKEFFFVRTEQQVNKIIEESSKTTNPIILYTIVENKLAKYLSKESENIIGLNLKKWDIVVLLISFILGFFNFINWK